MKYYWFLYLRWYLLGREKRLIKEIEYHHRERLRAAQAAYDVPDMMNRPMEWARHTHNCNWHGHWWRQAHAKLREVRTEIDKLNAFFGSN